MTSVKATPVEAPAGSVVPGFSTHVHFMRKVFVVTIPLHKIPDKYINLNPTEKEFYLDTNQYSKKYFLKFRYPNKIKVDTSNIETDFTHDVLTVTLKITQILDIHTGKLMGFRGKTKPKGESVSKKKQVEEEEEMNDEEDNVDEEQEEDENDEEEEHEEDEENEEDGEEHEDDEEQEEEEEEEKDTKKKKSKAPATKETALKILEEIGDKEEAIRKKKLASEASKEKYFQKKAAEREAVKASKKAIKEQTMKTLLENHKAEKAEAKAMSTKKVKRVVQFAEDEAPPKKRSKRN